jgi:predicted RNase H-related nuclease YkuK (DUF458 family)
MKNKMFRLFGGDELKDVGLYVKDYLRNNPEVKVFIGTDSRQYRNYTKYVTVIGLLKPRKGVHIIFKRENISKIRDIFSRLWNEVEYSRDIADYIESVVNEKSEKKIVTVHLDINFNKETKSSIVHDSAVGYLKGLGYNVETKPDSWAASKAADMLCK